MGIIVLFKRVCLLLVSSLMLSACGYTGALYLPKQGQPAEDTQTAPPEQDAQTIDPSPADSGDPS
jgi:predicted small lipoprotein YifL